MNLIFVIIVFLFSSFNVWARHDYDFSALNQLAFATNSLTNSVLVYHKGSLVYERYDNGFNSEHKHIAWSVSKSISSVILGALVKEKKINLHQSICSITPAISVDNSTINKHCDLTPHDFLSWSSGLIWNEQYENEAGDPTKSSVAQMLYGDGVRDTGAFVLMHTSNAQGKVWNYSTGDSHFVMSIAKAAVSANEQEVFPWKYLFAPLGISDVTFQRDIAGTFGGGSSIYIKPRDLAKVGLLFLNKGVWNGQQIITEEWIQYTWQTPESFDLNSTGAFQSRRSWWGIHPTLLSKYNMPEALVANGHWGQYLVIMPELDLVIVRMGNNQMTGFPIIQMIAAAVNGVDPTRGAGKSSDLLKIEKMTINESREELLEDLPIYQAPLFVLGLNYRAQHMCNCLFVMKQTESYCDGYSQVNPPVFSVSVDSKNKKVQSYIGGQPIQPVTFKFSGDMYGCVLESNFSL